MQIYVKEERVYRKEIKYALDVADEQPEGTIFIIPLRLEECAVPEQLSEWQWVNYFEEQGYDKLVRALRARASEIGAATLSPRERRFSVSDVEERPLLCPPSFSLTLGVHWKRHLDAPLSYQSDAW